MTSMTVCDGIAACQADHQHVEILASELLTGARFVQPCRIVTHRPGRHQCIPSASSERRAASSYARSARAAVHLSKTDEAGFDGGSWKGYACDSRWRSFDLVSHSPLLGTGSLIQVCDLVVRHRLTRGPVALILIIGPMVDDMAIRVVHEDAGPVWLYFVDPRADALDDVMLEDRIHQDRRDGARTRPANCRVGSPE